MLKIRYWMSCPEDLKGLIPDDAPEVEVVDDEINPLRGFLVGNVLDEDVRFAYREGDKVYVMNSLDSHPERVPDDLVHLVSNIAHEDYVRATTPGLCFP